MWPTWERERARIEHALLGHSQNVRVLPGISNSLARHVLSLQFIASLRREKYYHIVQARAVSRRRANPNSQHFDAERAVAFHIQNRDLNEASWLLFLMAYFARPEDTGWLRLRDVYGKLGTGIWDWRSVSADARAFERWLAQNWHRIRGKFGNHRKYETLRPNSNRSAGRVIASYVRWVNGADQTARFAAIVRRAGNDPNRIFDEFYKEFDVLSFGRLGKFDFLSLLGRYGVVPMDAGSAYLDGATGPLMGARLLFDRTGALPSSPATLQMYLDVLDRDLQVTMKVMEDALCNWQKSPMRFVHFTG